MEFDIETIRQGIGRGRERLPEEFAEVSGGVFAELETKVASVLADHPEPISSISIELFSEVAALAEASRYYYRMRGEELLDQSEIAEFLGVYINFLNSLVHWDVPPGGGMVGSGPYNQMGSGSEQTWRPLPPIEGF